MGDEMGGEREGESLPPREKKKKRRRERESGRNE